MRRLIIIDKDGSTAIYIAAETKKSAYEHINNKYFEPFINSIKLN